MVLFLAELTAERAGESEYAGRRANLFISLANMYEVLCSNGRYWASAEEPAKLYNAYLIFRDSYARVVARVSKLAKKSLGVAAAALENGQLRWPVIPKLHQTEHLMDLSCKQNPVFCAWPVLQS